MASPSDSISMALFCDFENVALGVRDAQYEKFDIKPILERLLLKGSIVVKKAYCDWERYKGFKATMHEANFELIEIPHVRQSGKNSADIRLVVDALDLCYTKSHVNTFVIISGDSDFSPLVSKLRENNKQVIGVGVKQSTSDLLIANCDEFIFYDDLVRENQRAQARRQNPGSNPPPAPRRSPEEERSRKESQDARRTQGVELAAETFEALLSERGDTGKIWASVLKEAIKRRKPDFSEGRYGFRTFGNLLEEAQARGLLEFGRDEKSGAYVFRSLGQGAGGGTSVRQDLRQDPRQTAQPDAAAERADHSAPARHDFHAVAVAAERPPGGGDVPSTTGRSRGRRGEAQGRAEAASEDLAERDEGMHAASHQPAAESPMDRPVSRYFSTPAVPVAAESTVPPTDVVAHAVTPADEQTAAQEAVVTDQGNEVAPATSRPRGQGRSSAGKGAAAGSRAAAPRARSAKTAGGANAAAGAAQPAQPIAAEAASPAEAQAQAPAKAPARPRSRVRKPADKSAE
ncbi:MAG: NYN domain-containing protein [Acidovorax sp.]|nr:NYN domain-containing protein [Acidovorax sp.]